MGLGKEEQDQEDSVKRMKITMTRDMHNPVFSLERLDNTACKLVAPGRHCEADVLILVRLVG